jgi:hypothetical protein
MQFDQHVVNILFDSRSVFILQHLHFELPPSIITPSQKKTSSPPVSTSTFLTVSAGGQNQPPVGESKPAILR